MVVYDISIDFHEGKIVTGKLIRRREGYPTVYHPNHANELFRDIVIDLLGRDDHFLTSEWSNCL